MNHTDMMAKLSRRPAVSGNQLWVEFFDRPELGQSSISAVASQTTAAGSKQKLLSKESGARRCRTTS